MQADLAAPTRYESSMLDDLLGDDDAARVRALVALEAGDAPIDEPLCRALIELCGHPRKEVSRRSAGALSRGAGAPPCRALIEAALGDSDARRRWGATFALARAGVLSDAVVGAAVDALASRDGDVRWAGAEIVCRAARERPDVASVLIAAAAAASPEQRKMALYCLRDIGADAASHFSAALADDDRSVRLAGLAGLARCASLAPEQRERLFSCVAEDCDEGVRRAARAAAARLAAVDRDVAVAYAALDGDTDKEKSK
jgi:hypothetical protein